MVTAKQISDMYISFFEKYGHKRIPNSPLIPENDPTTLFTSSGMQPLVPYLLGEPHPAGKRLVNVQNSFRAQDIDEIGDNRHTTFFRMLGNWSLGDYFKKEQLPWLFEFLTKELNLPPEKLYVTVFEGYKDIPKDIEAVEIWKELFTSVGINPEGRIFQYGTDKNWWSRAGGPDKMPAGEPGGPSSEVFYDFETEHDLKFGEKCHLNCDCGRYVEIANSVFMQYKKLADGSLEPLKQKNVDFGGGLERLLLAAQNNPDVFQTNLLKPIIEAISKSTEKEYKTHNRSMRIVTDHFIAATFISSNNITPSNKDQGYLLRRLIRRGLDHWYELQGKEITPILESVVEQYKETDPYLTDKFEQIKLTILEEEQLYKKTLQNAKKLIDKELNKTGTLVGDELMGTKEISADVAFKSMTSYGLGPTQLKNLGYSFDEQALAEKIKQHQALSRQNAGQKFAGGLADHQERTIMGHTATHLMHQALRDILGSHVHQTGSNITAERVRFDFNYEQKLTDEEIKRVEHTVNQKIKEKIPLHFEMLPLEQAKKIGAIGLFDDKYQDKVKVYFIGGSGDEPRSAYSKEFCGGPHVDFTSEVKSFKIIKQENIGHGQRRLYAVVG